MTSAKPKSEVNCGQLVGINDNVLVYTPDSTKWTFKRSNNANTDDLGTWGEVVRIGDIETNILTFNENTHTVMVKSAVASMSTPTDFVKTALNIQLNQGKNYDCLIFEGDNRTTLLSTNLTLNADISLEKTGITGFMRDGGNVEDIGSFTGTLEGNCHTITLAIGEVYGVCAENQTDGMGQIYRHQHNGLFSVLAGTVQNLTIAGDINVRNCVDGMNIGGVSSRNGGDVTLIGVTAKETINYHENTNVSGTESAGKNIGGFIGFIGEAGDITINGESCIESTFNLSGKHQNWNVHGGAIGKITANEFTVKIGEKDNSQNQLTNKLNVNVSNVSVVGENNDGGGLIGYITNEKNAYTNYNECVVNFNNLVYDSCTIRNTASKNGGGFLGYAWLNTTANINGVTIKGDSKIENYTTNGTVGGNKNVGAMCYVATGKWKVDSLNV